MPTPDQRREELKAVFELCSGCTKCPQLAASRTRVVFGAGNADAELMFVGEAPGAREDEKGLPFVGRAGALLDQLLGEVGLSRKQVFVANTLKCRPPGNRDPHPIEIDNCQDYLLRQVELIEPRLICTLGNFATKLLRGDQTAITRVRGRDEVRVIGRRAVRLMPLLHPAAALYTRSMLDTLRADFARIPELLALPAPEQPGDPVAVEAREPAEGAGVAAAATAAGAAAPAVPDPAVAERGDGRQAEGTEEDPPGGDGPVAPGAEQLGLF
jgi:uracil-DNA glycosylase